MGKIKKHNREGLAVEHLFQSLASPGLTQKAQSSESLELQFLTSVPWKVDVPQMVHRNLRMVINRAMG